MSEQTDPAGEEALPRTDEEWRRRLTPEQAKEILHRHKVEKLLVVDRDRNLKGLITVKDIQKQIKYPNACKDSLGRKIEEGLFTDALSQCLKALPGRGLAAAFDWVLKTPVDPDRVMSVTPELIGPAPPVAVSAVLP